mgnify:CR=1 FL=1
MSRNKFWDFTKDEKKPKGSFVDSNGKSAASHESGGSTTIRLVLSFETISIRYSLLFGESPKPEGIRFLFTSFTTETKEITV